MIESENIVKAVKWIDKYRMRIIILFLTPVFFAATIYFASDILLKNISSPLNGEKLYFMTPVEGVMAKIKVSFFGGLIASFPVIEIFIASIFSSLLKKGTMRKIYFIIIPFSTVSLAGGLVFGYNFILPNTIKFLINSGKGIMDPMISGSNYVSFIAFFMLAIAMVFELPLILVALSRINIVKSHYLMKKRKVAILITLIVLAILTPTPDAFTLFAVSLPVLLLYEISIWWIYILEKISLRKLKKGVYHAG